MIKKTIKYLDFDGAEHVEELWFHIPANKLADLEFGGKERLTTILPGILEAAKEGDGGRLLHLFTKIVAMSYGIRTDASHFEQNEIDTNRFISSVAFDVLWRELATSEKAITEFTIGIMPADMQDEIRKELNAAQSSQGAGELPVWVREGRKPTNQELMSMSREDLVREMQRQSRGELKTGGPEET